jgi:hypothetical protein
VIDAGPNPVPRVRYVVLHHTGWGEPHFDLMIEPHPSAERLLTWRTAGWPLAEGAALTALPPHRHAYLEFEGRLSGGRGQVRRVDGGHCRVVRVAEGVVVQLDGTAEAWVLGEVARRVGHVDA